MTSTAKTPAMARNNQASGTSHSSRAGILPGISSDFSTKSYPSIEKFTLGGKIDIRG